MTLFEAQTGGAFDRLTGNIAGNFDQNFSKKSNAPGFARGGGGMGGFGIDRYIITTSQITLHTIFENNFREFETPNAVCEEIIRLHIFIESRQEYS